MPRAAAGVEQATQVRVESVEVLVTPVGPAVVLRVRDKAVPIFIDVTVARSIQGALSSQKPPRPLTHDLMHAVIEGFGGKVTQVEVTLKDKIFYAALTVRTPQGARVFDSRSSDAIALAIHFKAPILVSEELVEAVGVEVQKPGETRS
jgi:hypothetical protein